MISGYPQLHSSFGSVHEGGGLLHGSDAFSGHSQVDTLCGSFLGPVDNGFQASSSRLPFLDHLVGILSIPGKNMVFLSLLSRPPFLVLFLRVEVLLLGSNLLSGQHQSDFTFWLSPLELLSAYQAAVCFLGTTQQTSAPHPCFVLESSGPLNWLQHANLHQSRLPFMAFLENRVCLGWDYVLSRCCQPNSPFWLCP